MIWLLVIFVLLLGVAIGSGDAQWRHRKNIGEAMLADTIGQSFSRPHLLLNNITLRLDQRLAGNRSVLHKLLISNCLTTFCTTF